MLKESKEEKELQRQIQIEKQKEVLLFPFFYSLGKGFC